MRQFVQYITLIGRVFDINNDGANFGLRCRSGDEFLCYVSSPETRYYVVRNLDEENDERFNPGEDQLTIDGRKRRVESLLAVGRLVQIEGILQINSHTRRVEVRRVNLLYVDNESSKAQSNLVFETNNWWVNQIKSLADRWIFAQFGNDSEFDFSKYRTYFDINFQPKDSIQETATLSRLIYGFASAYLLTGNERYLKAARNGVLYQREHFRVYKDEFCFWSYGKNVDRYSTVFPSQSGDDKGTIPLYEQIYALAGLTQYYRITQDELVFDDIRRTVLAFIKFFKDNTQGGYFSHIDPFNLRYDSESLGINRAKKNWNSIGDHIPAYLINLLIVIEPLAKSRKDPVFDEFLKQCQNLLEETSRLIVEKFPETIDEKTGKLHNFVYERFDADWKPDVKYSWQQNRGIVGHNLKIAWNLLRVFNYYESKTTIGCPGTQNQLLGKMKDLAEHLGKSMVDVGAIDLHRGGCFDALERNPSNKMSLEFSWLPTKDFWQQEQGILAYLILYGQTRNQFYLELAQEMSAFWNISFLDRKVGGVFFRTNENGDPVVKDSYGDKGGHAISGYHAFELCYLAHIYTCAYVTGQNLHLHLKPTVTSENQLVSVLPDFMSLKSVKLQNVTVNGKPRMLSEEEKQSFYVRLGPNDNQANVSVELGFATENYIEEQPPKKVEIIGKIGILVESHYDETEIRVFRDFFPKNGYQVEYISYNWNAPSAIYTGNDHDDPLVVKTDISDKNFNPKDYAGFIFVGGYATDRLRYQEKINLATRNESEAVKFLRRIINLKMKIGVICHSAWLFTVDKDLMKNRSLTCAHNIVYDVINAGGNVMLHPDGTAYETHVDGDLISGQHPEVAYKFAEVFLKEISKNKPNVDIKAKGLKDELSSRIEAEKLLAYGH